MNGAAAEYLLVGGYAVAVHAAPRFTADLDVWVNATPENARRVHEALARFGAPLAGLTLDDLSRPGVVLQIGVRPHRIDVLTSVDGVRFEEAWPERLETTFDGERVHVIGRRHLIANKRATGRPQDLLDVAALEQAAE